MQKTIAFILVLLSFAACTLDKLEPAQTKAFMKFFGDRGNTTGADLLKLDDGYLLLGNNLAGAEINAVLIKVDLNGNQLWSNTFNNLIGNALAAGSDGYFIIGNGIDGTNPTSMKLLKTDLTGTEVSVASLGEGDPSSGAYRGAAVTISSLNEVVVLGAISSGNEDSTFLYGYDLNLNPTWTQVRSYHISSANSNFSPSNNLIETNSGQFIWSGLITTGNTSELKVYQAASDAILEGGTELAKDLTLRSTPGGINYSAWSPAAYVQSVTTASGSGIAYANFDKNGETSPPNPNVPSIITENNGNYFGYDLVRANNSSSIIILGSTDYHPDDPVRSDLDFYIQEVVFEGLQPPQVGFKNHIGGTGNETGVAIVPADDGGYVFLGTMRNTNDTNIMVLVKVNNNGELLN